MSVKSMCRAAVIGCILAVVFRMFSAVLYLELVSFTLVMLSLVFDRKEAVSGCLLFGAVNMLTMGITPWSIGYLLMYPSFALLTCVLKKPLLQHPAGIALYCGLLSFLSGQLIDLPFLLFSSKATVIYMLMGIKTSLFQGVISGIVMLFLFERVYRVLYTIKERMI